MLGLLGCDERGVRSPPPPASTDHGNEESRRDNTNRPGVPAAPGSWAGVEDEYRAVASQIIEASLGSGRAHGLLTELCDDIGARLSGSPSLDRALVWARDALREAGHAGVAIEKVMVPRWVRGQESLTLLAPRRRSMRLLGLGNSVGTPAEGVRAPVMVVDSMADLEQRRRQAKGKVVLFNVPMPAYDTETRDPGYGSVVGVRVQGASLAAAHGAVAALVRSLTATSLSTPHTGTLRYDEDKPRIPAAAITVEDAAFIARLAGRGLPVEVRLTMEARDGGMVESGNVVAQLEGRERPQEIVVIGGHIDSWDVGQGAHDNGSGVVIAMEALNLLRRLGLAPRRTIRVVLWTNEENGLMGAKGYAKAHEEELPDHVAGIESDTGGARVVQLNVQHRDQAVADRARGRLSAIASLLQPLGANRVVPGSSGADLGPLRETGMVGIGLRHDVSHYFDIHHTEADTLDKVEASDLDQGVASLAITAYVLADIPGTLVSD